jgi:hypothetical protein
MAASSVLLLALLQGHANSACPACCRLEAETSVKCELWHKVQALEQQLQAAEGQLQEATVHLQAADGQLGE